MSATKRVLIEIFILIIACLKLDAQISFKESASENNVMHHWGIADIGGGVSIYDFNQDGLDDLTLATNKGLPIGFYQNTGSGFELIESLINNTENVKQINWVDYDNDGDPDLYVAANQGINRLYRNEGDLQLRDVTEESGLSLDIHYGYGACWGDYNRDGWLDLYYASKGNQSGAGINRLFKNNADGSFTERTYEARVSDKGKLPFCAAFLDYNNDMWPDIYIANDKLTYNTLFENTGRGFFLDAGEESGANVRMNAMCVNPGDFNRDGWMDIYITNTPIGSYCLQNTGVFNQRGYVLYEEKALQLGIHFPGGNGWGSNFFDADNDGDLDLYVCSSISAPLAFANIFYENIEGEYFDTPFIDGFQVDIASSFTNAIGDFNNDGRMDIVVQNNPPENFYLWENTTPTDNHWVKVDLEGKLSNKDGVGSKIEAYAQELYQMFFTTCGSGFLGQNSSFKHIGTGIYEKLDSLIVTWPTGHIDKLYDIPTHQLIHIKEGQSNNGRVNIDEDVTILERQLPTTKILEEEISFSLYPNPAKSHLILETKEPIHEINILNAKGQHITIPQPKQRNRFYEIMLDDLKEGVYFLEVKYSGQQAQMLKWIKI